MTIQDTGFALTVLATLLALAPIAAGQERPAIHPEFREGYRAFEHENWEEAANLMMAAQKNWGEDGVFTKTTGNWTRPYLPLYYLGVSLYELGCYQEALACFDRTLLAKQPIARTKRESENLISLKQNAESYLNWGEERDAEYCSKWRLPEDENDNGQTDPSGSDGR